MENENSLGEKVGNILHNIEDKEELLDWLSRQPLSREWEKEDILNCKPEYMAVLTEKERDMLLSSKERSLATKYNRTHPPKPKPKEEVIPINNTGCLIMIMTVLFVAFFIKNHTIGSVLIITNLIITLIFNGPSKKPQKPEKELREEYVRKRTPRKQVEEYAKAHPQAREEFLKTNQEIRAKEEWATACISEDYFNRIDKMAKAFDNFLRKCASQHCVKYYIKHTIQWNGKPLGTSKTLERFAGLDMLRISERLGHPYDRYSLASLPFIITGSRFARGYVPLECTPFYLCYWELNSSLHDFRKEGDVFREEIMQSVGENAEADVDFFGVYLLQKSGYHHEEEYLRLIYRFASLVAKADGNISDEEAEILKGIQRQINEYCQQNSGKEDLPPILPPALPQKPEQPAITATDAVSTDATAADKATADTRQSLSPDEAPAAEAPVLPEANRLKPALEKLDELIGLEGVKSEIHKLHNYVKIQRKREVRGMKTVPLAVHCVFTGNPGTGKTTVARILAEIFKELGLLKKGHLVETDRSGLVGEYVGQTAVKTNKIIDSALDGVLFIDEAYTLAAGGGNDYGGEAVATLLKRMEDDRGRLIVIIAGYENEMQQFIDMNPGLQSRFTRYIRFEDYDTADLVRIFLLNTTRYGYTLTADAESRLQTLFADMAQHKDEHFGNAREVRNLFEQTLQRQADRLIHLDNVTNRELSTIEAEDIAPVQTA